jgi:membrane-associated phospholipid phosphatase
MFYHFFKNIKSIYFGRNLLWQGVFIVLTAICVVSGIDWIYYSATRSTLIQTIGFSAALVGFVMPPVVIGVMLLGGYFTKNKRMLSAVPALIQAGVLGLAISSFYKVFTGRVGPPHALTSLDTSHVFRFGILRGGAFQGWPSSHTSVAFAMSMALITLFPENKVVRYCAMFYAFYIGIGVSATIHWFSDFVAGAILGTIIGISVGKSYLDKYKQSIAKV